MNVYIKADRERCLQEGFRFAIVYPQGEQRGHIMSRHRTPEEAAQTLHGDLTLVDLKLETHEAEPA